MTVDPDAETRRRLLVASGSLAALGLAGCLGDDAEEEDPGDDEDDEDEDDHDEDDHDEDDHDHDHDEEVAEEAFDELGVADEGFVVLDRAHDPHEEVAYVHGDHWHGSLPHIEVGDNVSLGAEIEPEDGDSLELGDEYELRVAEAHDAPEGIVGIDEGDYHGDHVHINGESEGITEVVFLIWHDDHADYQSPPIDAQVVEEDDHEHEHEHEFDAHHVADVRIFDRAPDPHEEVAHYHDDHWDGELPTVPVGEHVSLGAEFEDDEGNLADLDHEFELRVRLADDADDIVEFDYHGDHVHVIGEEEGTTEVVFQLWHDDHADFETEPIAVDVEDDGY